MASHRCYFQRAAACIGTAISLSTLQPCEAASKPPLPHILLNGVDITGKTVSVYAGQKLALTTTPPPVPGQVQLWVPGAGPVLGGFSTETDKCPISPKVSKKPCGGPIDPILSEPSTTLYYTGSGSYDLIYGYKVNGKISTATTTISVTGPPSTTISAQTSNIAIANSGTRYRLGLGDRYQKIRGIVFNASTNDVNVGSYKWVQILVSVNQVYRQNNIPYQCQTLSGLDNSYPYDIGSNTFDSPSVVITGFDTDVFSFGALMYLMWLYDSDSIPVPLGKVTWGFVAQAIYDNVSQVWLPPSGNIITPVIDYLASYPIWYSVAVNPDNRDYCSPAQ